MGKRQRKIGPEDWIVGPQAVAPTCGPCSREGGEDMDEESSWMRVAMMIAIDWRFIAALVVLALAFLLLR